MSYPAIILPWPNRDLHPNARVHWGKHARAAKKARQDGANATLAAGIRKIDAESLVVRPVIFPPNRHARDDDGIVSSLKSYFDGIADIIGIDDSKWRLGETVRRDPIKHGAVHVEITVQKDDQV